MRGYNIELIGEVLTVREDEKYFYIDLNTPDRQIEHNVIQVLGEKTKCETPKVGSHVHILGNIRGIQQKDYRTSVVEVVRCSVEDEERFKPEYYMNKVFGRFIVLYSTPIKEVGVDSRYKTIRLGTEVDGEKESISIIVWNKIADYCEDIKNWENVFIVGRLQQRKSKVKEVTHQYEVYVYSIKRDEVS